MHVQRDRLPGPADIDVTPAAPQRVNRVHHRTRRRTGTKAIDADVGTDISSCLADTLGDRSVFRRYRLDAFGRQRLDAFEQRAIARHSEDGRHAARQREQDRAQAERS